MGCTVSVRSTGIQQGHHDDVRTPRSPSGYERINSYWRRVSKGRTPAPLNGFRKAFGGSRRRPPSEPDSLDVLPSIRQQFLHHLDDKRQAVEGHGAYPRYGLMVPRPSLVNHEYKFLGTLGRGAFSVVKEAASMCTGILYAIKIIPLRGQKAYSEAQLLEEIKIASEMRHPGIVQLHEFFVEPTRVCLVMELLAGGALLDTVIERGALSEADARLVLTQVLSALAYLHRHGVAHRDVKLENILLRAPRDLSQVKLADFGLSKCLDGGAAFKTIVGTPTYLAPEIIRALARHHERSGEAERGNGASSDGKGKGQASQHGDSSDMDRERGTDVRDKEGQKSKEGDATEGGSKPASSGGGYGSRGGGKAGSQQRAGASSNGAEDAYTVAVDMWSAGVVMFILLAGYPPFDGVTNQHIYDSVLNLDYRLQGEPWDGISEEAKDLLRSLLVLDPAQRLTAEEALVHPWLRRAPGRIVRGDYSSSEIGDRYHDLARYYERFRPDSIPHHLSVRRRTTAAAAAASRFSAAVARPAAEASTPEGEDEEGSEEHPFSARAVPRPEGDGRDLLRTVHKLNLAHRAMAAGEEGLLLATADGSDDEGPVRVRRELVGLMAVELHGPEDAMTWPPRRKQKTFS